MAKFRKQVVRPGVFKVHRLDGSQDVEVITPERLKAVAEETNKLIALGVSVPAPFMHQDKEGKFPAPIIIGNDGASLTDARDAYGGEDLPWDAAINGGFWDHWEVDESGALVGEVASPGEESDSDSPAGKVGKTVRETSVLIMPEREVMTRDGKTHKIGPHLAHVAMCLHGQEPAQKNFEPVLSLPEECASAMSFAMSDVVGGGQSLPDPTIPVDSEMEGLLVMLRALYIDLPDTTTRDNLVENLSLALRQKLADQHQSKQEEGSLTRQPADSQVKGPSIAMSQTIPTDGAQPTSSDKTLSILMGQVIDDRKKRLRERVKQLVESGRITSKYADEKLYPLVEGFTMSAEDVAAGDKRASSTVETLVEGLEQADPLAGPAKTDTGGSNALPEGAEAMDPPDEGDAGDIPDEMADEIIGEAIPGGVL